MKLSRVAVVLVMALALLGGRFMVAPAVSAEAECVEDCGEKKPKKVEEQAAPAEEEAEPAVVIDGGTVTSETVIDISADGGTAISDGSGGDENFAFANAGAEVVVEDEGGEGPRSVLGLRDDLVGGDDAGGDDGAVAAAGNGGTADAAANGGAIAVGDINSGGNAGNVIAVGDTGAPAEEEKEPAKPEEPKKPAPVKPEAPKPVAPKPDDGKKVVVDNGKISGGGDDNGGGSRGSDGGGDSAPRARGGDRVRDLPSTGTGVAGEAGTSGALLALVGGLAAAGYAARRRFA